MHRFCHKCGSRLEGDSNFCTNCGSISFDFGKNTQKNMEYSNDKENNALKIASLVIGIVSIVLSFFFSFFVIPAAIVGLVLGIVYSSRAKKFCIGIVLNILGVILPILFIILLIFVFNSIEFEIEDLWENENNSHYEDRYESDDNFDYNEPPYNDSNDNTTDKYFKQINLNELINFINNKKSFVLVVSQTGCGHCINYKPKIKKVASDYKFEIYYIEYDLLSSDEKRNFANYIDITGTPTTVFFKNGVENIDIRISGDTDESEIVSVLKNNGYIK